MSVSTGDDLPISKQQCASGAVRNGISLDRVTEEIFRPYISARVRLFVAFSLGAALFFQLALCKEFLSYPVIYGSLAFFSFSLLLICPWRYLPRVLLLVCLAFLVPQFVSSIASFSPAYSLLGFSQLSLLVFPFLVCVPMILGPERLLTVLKAIVLCSHAIVLICIIFYPISLAERYAGPFNSVAIMCHYSIATFAILAAVLVTRFSLSTLLLLGISVCLAILSGYRTALLVQAIGLALLLLLYSASTSRRFVSIMPVLAVLFVCTPLILGYFTDLTFNPNSLLPSRPDSNSGYYGRLDLWQIHLDSSEANSAFGRGPAYKWLNADGTVSLDQELSTKDPHNLLLLLLCQTGYFGIVVYIGMLGILAFLLLLAFIRGPALARAYCTAILIFAASWASGGSMTTLGNATDRIYWALLGGFILVITARHRATNETHPSHSDSL
ncbi:MAG: O-antigen ligase family protein [Candidatus Brocadiia bacterium]